MPPPSPSPEYKHFCRVCNKGFTCGSALGGHMRAHGSSDDVHGVVVDDDDDESLGDEPARGRGSSDNHQWDAAGPSSSAATHAYALRANPNRLVRSCQVCKNCGREFTSWDLFLEHGRCVSDDEGGRADADDGSLRPSLSPPSDAEDDDGEEDPAVAAAWSKGKRSRRVKLLTAVDEASAEPSRRCASGEEEDLANCLVMLSSSSNIEHAATVVAGTSSQQEPCAPASKERDREPQLLQPISFLAPAPEPVMALPSAAATIQYASPAPRGMFECKACKKVFTSHQALGGHRASHKKVKGCFAARFESNVVSETPTSSHAATTADPSNDNGKGAAAEASTTHTAADAKPSIYASTDGDANVGTSETAAALSMALVGPVVHEPPVAAAFNVAAAAAAPSKKNAKMHECSVCHRLFTSGQALGGHKRCHWLTTSSTADPTNPVANLTVPPLTEDIVGAVRHQLMLRPMMADAPEPALDLTIAAKPLPLTTAPPLVVQAEPGCCSSSSFHHLDASAPAQLRLQSPVVIPGNASYRNKTSTASGHAEGDDAAAGSTAAEDEGENSTVIKRARFTDLKDVVRMDGEATEPWLQVGIGSSSAGGDDKSARG